MRDPDDLDPGRSHGVYRRLFLGATGIIAASTIADGLSVPALARQTGPTPIGRPTSGRRILGKLEVSSVGLGCQDITGTFYATAPRRPDMVALVRAPEKQK